MLPQHGEVCGSRSSGRRLPAADATARDLRWGDLRRQPDLLLARREMRRPLDRRDQLSQAERIAHRRVFDRRILDRRIPSVRIQRRLPPDRVLFGVLVSPLSGAGHLSVAFKLRLQHRDLAILRLRRGELFRHSDALPSRRSGHRNGRLRYTRRSSHARHQPRSARSGDLLRHQRPMRPGPTMLLHHHPLLRPQQPVPVHVSPSGNQPVLPRGQAVRR
jgi:hypothetical protein